MLTLQKKNPFKINLIILLKKNGFYSTGRELSRIDLKIEKSLQNEILLIKTL